MIRALPLLAMAFAVPAPTQQQPTVEQVHAALDAQLPQVTGITLTQVRDDVHKTSLLVRTVESSRTPKRCETEFATPKASIVANAKAERSFRVAWSAIGEVRRDGGFKVELVLRRPDGVSSVFEFPDGGLAEDFAQAFDFLRRHCAA